jgi:peptidoglycan/xylan/chitin deacetylase (PgdA/CDA1 family)
VRAYPGLARRIARAGHLIGNHSNFHAPMPSLTEAGVREDVGKAHAAIETLVGVDPRPWFRCPFGAGMDDPVVRGRLAELGYSSIGWNCAPQDWRERRTGDEVRAAVLAGADRVGGGDLLVVMHSWPDATAAALPGLLAALAAAGASFAGVDELGDTDRFLAGAPPA